MKKLYAMIAGFLLFVIVVFGFDQHLDKQIMNNKEAVRNHRTYERFWSSETQKLVMDENTLPIFGSSELVSLEDCEENISSFLNSPDMNIVTIGGGYFQSLSHAMELGAISEEVESKKVALFLSPQWFEEMGVSKEAFPGRFGEENLLEFLANDRISDTNKTYVLGRVLTLLEDSSMQRRRVERYKKSYENKVSVDGLYTNIMRNYWKLRGKYSVFKQIDEMTQELPVSDLKDMDFEELLSQAEKQGRNSCTNNNFGIYDEYWDTYVKDTFQAGEVKEKTEIYTESLEYEDLRCFLRVAQELDIEVIVVSIPVNEAWYTFRGKLCDKYYKKVKLTACEFDNVRFLDMTKYADEKYFHKDVMHLGWKGWVRINEALYREFKEE